MKQIDFTGLQIALWQALLMLTGNNRVSLITSGPFGEFQYGPLISATGRGL
jgi:hypothetical protein